MKKWWQSKTVWLQVITLVVGVLGATMGVVTGKLAVILLIVVIAFLNGILRIFFTDTGIGSTPPTP